DQIDSARLGIDQERRDRVTTLEIEPPHLLAHASVVALEPQPRLVDLEEIVEQADRKSTRLNSSHGSISYAVFCLKKKKQTKTIPQKDEESDHLVGADQQERQYQKKPE